MVSSVNPSRMNALHKLMQAAAQGPQAKAKIITSDDANAALQEFSKLQPAQQENAKALLSEAFQKNVFEIDDGSRSAFANAFGMKPQELSPQQAQKLGGMNAQRTIADIATDAIKKQKIISPDQMKNIVAGAEKLLGKEGQAFVAANLLNQNSEGVTKMDPKARKPFVKWMAGLDQDKSVSDWKTVMETPRTAETSAFSRAMAGAETFEQLVAAFMMFICGEIQDKTTDKMAEADGAHQAQKKDDRAGDIRDTATKLANGLGIPSLSSVPDNLKGDLIKETANRLGLEPQTVASEIGNVLGNAVQTPGGQTPGAQTPGAQTPGAQTPGADAQSPATPTPDAAKTGDTAKTNAPKEAGGGFSAFVDKTKDALDATLNSTHAHLHDKEVGGKFDGLSGIISKEEAAKIAGKLTKLPPPAGEIIANTMMGALLNSSLKLGGAVKPIADWAAKMLGGWDNVDLDQVMKGHPIQKVTGKLEHTVTDFIVGALEASAKTAGLNAESARPALEKGVETLKGKMKELKSFQNQFKDNPAAKEAWEKASAAPLDKNGQPEAGAAEATKPKEAPGATPPADANTAPTNTAPTNIAPKADATANAAAPEQFAGVSETDTKKVSQKSTAMLFEELKQLQQELQQVMQALSNVLNMMKENAMNAIRSIR